MLKKFILKILLAFIALTHLQILLSNEATEDDSMLKLQVGSIRISNYIYNRELSKVNRDTFHKEFDEVVWRNRWIEKLKIVCEARSHGYANDPDLKNDAKKLTAYMLTSSLGGPYARTMLSEPNTPSLSKQEKMKLLNARFRQEERNILRNVNKTVNNDAATYFMAHLLSPNPPIDLDTDEKTGQVLFRYREDDSDFEVSIQEMIEYLNQRVIGQPLHHIENLRSEIDNLIIYQHRLKKALELKLDKDWRFTQERENFINNTIYNIYLAKEVHAVPQPSQQAIKEYYQNELESLAVPQTIDAWTIYSDSRRGLFELRSKIARSFKAKKTNEMDEIFDKNSSIKNVIIRVGESNYEKNYSLGLLDTSIGQFTRVAADENGTYSCFLIKEIQGSYLPPLTLVRSKIEALLIERMQADAVRSLLEKIEEKYQFRAYSTTEYVVETDS